MYDTFVTFHGWAGSEVRHRSVRDLSVATLRVASTPRWKRDGTWVDGETTWYSVTAWRALADHVRDSVRKGDPLIVHGRLRTETWKPEDGPASTTLHVEALLIGHDMSRGISHFIKRPVRQLETEERPATAAGPWQSQVVAGNQPATEPGLGAHVEAGLTVDGEAELEADVEASADRAETGQGGSAGAAA